MNVDFDDVESAVLDAFDKSLGAIEPAAHDAGLGATAAELARYGWMELASGATESGISFTLLAGCAERLGQRQHPLPFPLLETWVAVRVLESVGATKPLAAVTSGRQVATVATDLLGGNETGGTSGYLPFAAEADLVLVPRRLADGSTAIHLLEHSAVRSQPASEIDPTLRCGYLPDFDLPDDRIVGVLDAAASSTAAAELLVLQAAEIVGAAAWLFEHTVSYLKIREQFGRALASFQALQHRAADLAVRLESARSLVLFAAWAADRRSAERIDYAELTKGYAAEFGIDAAAEAIQLHGGQGFTVEMGLHHDTQRILHRAITGLHCRTALTRAGARAIDNQQLLGSFLPAHLRPGAAWLAEARHG